MSSSEEWKPMVGHTDYLVSNFGNVKKAGSDTLLSKQINSDGYEYVQLRIRVSREVAKAFIPNPENKPFIDHINRVRSDNRAENLRWATMSENNLNRDFSGRNNNQLKQPNISLHRGRFQFRKMKEGVLHRKDFNTLEEAIAYRESYS